MLIMVNVGMVIFYKKMNQTLYNVVSILKFKPLIAVKNKISLKHTVSFILN
jgi:hypothetical protein